LSRTVEDSGTVIVPLVPWSIAGVYMSGTLGVPTVEYWKWAFMCYLGVFVAIIYGFTGFAIAPKINDDETVPGS
ncbi:MAG: Na+/H+ antiporter NhaC, partial [bacterium]|nr:Na+/H+ antiporter NhaC [bacterium]